MQEIIYGNPCIEEKKIIETPCLVGSIFEQAKEKTFPFNDSELVKDELNELVDLTSSMHDPENNEFLLRYKAYDRNLINAIISTFKQKGIDCEELSHNIVSDISPVILKLKYFFKRPRPHQLAGQYKLALFPFKSYSDKSPSYPSENTILAFVILNVIGNKHPQHYHFCKAMAEDVGISRIYLGLNFPSDIDFSKFVGKEILKHSEFSKKYEI